MAFIVQTKGGRFEVRESHSTVAGPRSRTLASFTEFGDEVVEKARGRAEKPIDAAELREAALRAGAPVAGAAVDEAARETLRRVAGGEQLDPMLRTLLLDALVHTEPSVRGALEARGVLEERGALGDTSPAPVQPPVSDAARSAAEWIGAGLGERGKALRDLLELGDALPLRRRPDEIGFPRLESAQP
jgi:hypothetical protein